LLISFYPNKQNDRDIVNRDIVNRDIVNRDIANRDIANRDIAKGTIPSKRNCDTSMKETRAAGVVLFRKEPSLSFLLLKHPNRWDLPKGHVDPGETDMQCALREMEEETGVTIDDIEMDPDFVFTIEYDVTYKKRFGEPATAHKTVLYYLATLRREVDLKLTEHGDFQWFDWSPPHTIQEETIDALLASIAKHWD
jgi:bis(5'-nucleosidyl)-tetraphosphatase